MAWTHGDEVRYIQRMGEFARGGNLLPSEKLRAVEGYISSLVTHPRRWDSSVQIADLLEHADRRKAELEREEAARRVRMEREMQRRATRAARADVLAAARIQKYQRCPIQ